VSYRRDRSTAETDHRPNGTLQPSGAGKASLVDGLIQRKADASLEPAGPGKQTLAATAQPAGAPAQPHGDGAMSRDVVPYDGYDHGVEAAPTGDRDPRITTPAPGGGPNVAATVLGAAADTERARDGALTPALIAALHANPDLSIDEVLQHLAVLPIGGERGGGSLQHPTIVQYGQMPQGTPGGEPSQKHAVLIANQSYENLSDLGSPLAEANQMQGELSSRGYDVNVHADKTAADMSTLWGSMVGSAKPGDDLVAHYGGHGISEGLLGINHDHPPGPPDLFSSSQVSGVVSSATGKGAHIRFVMDSCHSGAQVQAVREVRENELAAAASSPDDRLRVDALASLRQMKQRLLGLREQRDTVPGQLRAALEQHGSRAPDPADAEATKKWSKIQSSLRDVEAVWVERQDRAEDQLWAELLPQIEAVRAMARHPAVPPPISDYGLGAQLNYLDDLWNAVSQPVEQAIATTQPGAPTPAAQ
jgi:hypothetical protein